MSELARLLECDAALCAAASADMGGIVRRIPLGVVRPRTLEDVVETVRWCRERRLRLAARGQGHTAYGQSLVEVGVVLDMGKLNRIHALTTEYVYADAGLTWRALLEQTLKAGRTPPVLTAFQGLSIGGTLSVGGLSGAAYKRGAQVDHVLSLDVVTGAGELVTCSREHERELYQSVLAGVGQCAIIVRAKLALAPAPSHVHHSTLAYRAPSKLLRDLRALVARGALDGVSATVFPCATGGPRYELNAFSFGAGDEPSANDAMLEGIAAEHGRNDTTQAYLDFYLQVDRLLEALGPAGWGSRRHPWFDVFLPDSVLDAWLDTVIPGLSALDVGPEPLGSLGQVHLFPLRRACLTAPLLRVPDEPLVFLFDILSAAPQPEPSHYVERMLQRNRRLYERACAVGGSLYPIAAIPLTAADWRRHYGERFASLARNKELYDPGRLLTPGAGVWE